MKFRGQYIQETSSWQTVWMKFLNAFYVICMFEAFYCEKTCIFDN
jgi:hypothetical protein